MKNHMRIESMLDLSKTVAAGLFEGREYPWEVLPDIGRFILELGAALPADKFDKTGDDIWIAKSAKVAPSASVTGPCIIDEEAEIRHCAFIRGNAVVGKGAVVGNSTELKNAVLFDKAQAPHYNYVGDSVMGYRAHTGAGVILSNLKSDKSLVTVAIGGGEKIPTGIKKFGAMIGDDVEVGCNSVLGPGAVICRNTTVYPTSHVRGAVAPNSIFKGTGNVVVKI